MKNWILVFGDIFTIVLVTLIGFATHGETERFFLPRMMAFFFPLAISWFLLAPSLGLFQREIISTPKQLWRPVLGMAFAAPFAAVLRGLILNAPVIPIFAVVLLLTSAFSMLVWRVIYWFLDRKVRKGV